MQIERFSKKKIKKINHFLVQRSKIYFLLEKNGAFSILNRASKNKFYFVNYPGWKIEKIRSLNYKREYKNT